MGQFSALFVKNWILYKRGIVGAVLQILLPIIFIAFVLLVRRLATITQIEEQTFVSNSTYDYNLGSFIFANNDLPFKNCSGRIIALAPSGNIYVNQMNTVLTGLGLTTQIYDSDAAINSVVRDFEYGRSLPYFCFGVTFESGPPSVKYNLKFNITRNARSQGPYTQSDITSERAFNNATYFGTYLSKMASTTHFVNSIILQIDTGISYSSVSGNMLPMYQEDFVEDPIYTFLGNSSEFLVLLPLLIIYLRQTSDMLMEKQKKIRESMSIMGMKLSLYYLTWFIRYFMVYLVVHLIGSAILRAALPNVPYGMFLIVFILFDILLIIQSFFIQIFFTRSKIGVVFALLFFVIQYVINYVISTNQNPSLSLNQAVSVVPHVAFILAFKEMLYAESVKFPITFAGELNNYTITTAIVSLICNIIFWGLLAMYLDQIVPNQWGAKKHPCFCCVNKNASENQEEQGQHTHTKVHPEKHKVEEEIESVEGKYKEMEKENDVIRLRHLVKNFGEVQAVKDLNLTIYQDQIFVLLGHNGAGKTTTINMLTGMLDPSHGNIEVLGLTEMEDIRTKIGVCPQHDTLYDDLTVLEHLELFATFKGLEGDQLDEQVNKLIADVNLEEKREEYSKNLSGGQKRRLSVAIAFTGGSKVIILDEPTSGMDTSARRYIWEMLKNYKNDRIIVLTTHFMDEADYLGDRIAIMAKGNLVTCGSSVYLKNKFGVGYNIVFVKHDISVKSDNIINCVLKYIPNAKILSDVSSQLAIQLPLDNVKQFSRLFGEVDSKKKQLGIQTYGISITTLEEVFLKVADGFEAEDKAEKQHLEIEEIQLDEKEVKAVQKQSKKKINVEISELDREDGCCERFVSHLLATILKRIRVIKRDIKSFLFELILPIVIIILALLLMTVSFITDSPYQELNYNIYYANESTPNPMLLPIGSSSSALLNQIQADIVAQYGNKFDIRKSVTSSQLEFDQNFLYPLKQSDQTLKGGIYFTEAAGPTYSYKAFLNTRSPTSILTVQTLAVESLMNYISTNTSTISMVNAPFPRTYNQLQIQNTISGFFGALIFSIALAFKFASIVSFIVKERVDKSKHQQIVSGMNIGSYWVGNFLYDYLLYAVVAGISVGVCVGLNIEALIEDNAINATAALFFLYGLANIPLTYILGYLFKDYGNAQAAVYFFNFVSGGIVSLVIYILRWISNEDDAISSGDIGRGLGWVLRIIPAFSFGQGLLNLGSITLLSVSENGGTQYSVFDMQITLSMIIYLVVFFFFYFALLFFMEYVQSTESLMRCCSSEDKIDETSEITDEDVLVQQEKAINADPEKYQILTKNLRKVFITDNLKGYKVAVDNLSFGVEKGEVFGLLGVNGAGKTTTFKILAGEIVSTSGDSYFNGYKISENLSRIRKNLGYCPQFDALIENLTVREQLELYYDMKCLPSQYKQQAITEKILEMNLQEYEQKLSGTLSGGNKRKLSVAMAMIGNPSIIFLDQPSTGMDPKARRFMWKVISRISTERKQSTIILTTHSMEEAEALSTRLGIMVNGNFKCIGTPQHIKSRYGKGFEIQVKLKILKKDQIMEIKKAKGMETVLNTTKNDIDLLYQRLQMKEDIKKEISADGQGNYLWKDLNTGRSISVASVIQFNENQERVNKIRASLNQKLGQTQIIEQLQTYVRFKTNSTVGVGGMFDFLENKKEEFQIQQYSIKQVTVEQIFNRFAEEDGNMMMD